MVKLAEMTKNEHLRLLVEEQMELLIQDWETTINNTMQRILEEKTQIMMTEIRNGVQEYVKKRLVNNPIAEFTGEFTIPDHEVPVTEEEETVQDTEPTAPQVQNEFVIPRREGTNQIDWANSTDGTKLSIFFHLIKQAEKQGLDVRYMTGLEFKKLGSDFNAAYQRMGKVFSGKGSWNTLINEYLKYEKSQG